MCALSAARSVAPPSVSQEAVYAYQAVLRLANVKVAPLVRAVGLRQRTFGVDPVLKVFRDSGKLARIMHLRRLQQARLGLTHRAGAHMVSRPGDHRHVLIAEVSPGKRFFGLGQLFELAGDPNPFGRRAARELAPPLQPGDDG